MVGNIGEKEGNRLSNNATMATRQPGSSIKPLVDYAPAFEQKLINYSTMLLDEPIPNYFDDGRAGPSNYSPGFEGEVTTRYALIKSLNPPAVRLLMELTPQAAASFLVDKLGFSTIAEADQVRSMAIGGSMGVTVREMTAGFQILETAENIMSPIPIITWRTATGTSFLIIAIILAEKQFPLPMPPSCANCWRK